VVKAFQVVFFHRWGAGSILFSRRIDAIVSREMSWSMCASAPRIFA
jgi:hypothetical protein